MNVVNTNFSGQMVASYFDTNFETLTDLFPTNKIVILTDETVFKLHQQKFNQLTVIKIDGEEKNKTQATVDGIITQLLALDVDKTFMLIGVGGGVVTDMAGYVASIYKRGIQVGLVPTTILCMVDAAIGGKNGVNVGIYKNMVGTTYRPTFILYDYSFLQTLPRLQWINGFAEIIKHACIKDASMFDELALKNIDYYINNQDATATLIQKNAALKMNVVVHDELEKADRFLLNFGHTFGHAVENIYSLPHGFAISLGMVIAAKISTKINTFTIGEVSKIEQLLTQYNLPIAQEIDKLQAFQLLAKDKKRAGAEINFVLLHKIGDATSQKISIDNLALLIDQIL